MTNNWAIVIGINHYDHHPERQLKYAVPDAQLMCDFLCTHAGFARDRILLCLGNQEDKDSKTYPRAANLFDLLDKGLSPDSTGSIDRLWFFFAGHGINQKGQDYLLTSDSLQYDIKRFALPVEEVIYLLRRHQAADIVLILDNCRQQQGSRKFIVEEIGKQTIELAQSRGITTIFSCDSGQYSYELDSLKQGAFTYALVEGLKQYTLPDKLEPYLRRRVAELNQRSDQIPRIRFEPAAKALQPLLPDAVTAADITVLVDRAREAELEENFETAKQLWWQIIRVAKSDDRIREAESAIRRIDKKMGGRSGSLPVTPSIDSRTSDRSMVNRQLTRQQFLKWAIPAGVGVAGVTIASRFLGEQSRQVSSSTPIDVTPNLEESPSPPFASNPSPTQSSTAVASPADIPSFIEKLKDGVVLEMVKIPGGKFQMGSLPTQAGYSFEESPQHEVAVNKFAIGKYPVTQAQWQVVAALPTVNRNLNLAPAYFQNPNHPVEQICWLDAIEFCERLSRETGRLYRLPTEAEWEYACRAGTTTSFYFDETLTQALANYSSNTTTPVGSFAANAFELHDMHGNVWECCADYWRRNYEGAPSNGSAQGDPNPNYARVIRGGSWAREASQCRSASRTWYLESTTLNFNFKRSEFGMRVACSI